MNGRRLELAAVLLILVFAIVIRWDGLTYGFPLIVHPDEPRIADPALRIVDTGDPHPHTLLYPSFLVYLDAAVFGLVRASHDGAVEAATYYYWGRIVTLATAVLTVLIVYFAARRLGGFIAAAAAAMVTAASLLHASNSVLITTDVPMAMWATATLAAALALTDASAAGFARYAGAGALVGLAVGTKYNAVTVAIAVAAAHLVCNRHLRAVLDPRLAAAAAASFAAFVLVTPYAVLDWPMLADFLELQRNAYTRGHPGNEAAGATSYAFYASALLQKFGAGALVAALIGLAWLLARDTRRAVVAASFPLAYFAFMGAYPVHFDRNMVAIVPALAILAGVGIAVATRAVAVLCGRARRGGARLATALAAGATIALVVVPQTVATGEHMARISLPDTRVLAKRWIETNLPPGARIAREQYTPPLDPERFEVVELGYYGLIGWRQPWNKRPWSEWIEQLQTFDYLIASKYDYGRFFNAPQRHPGEHARYNAIFARFPTIQRIAPAPSHANGPVIRILAVKH